MGAFCCGYKRRIRSKTWRKLSAVEQIANDYETCEDLVRPLSLSLGIGEEDFVLLFQFSRGIQNDESVGLRGFPGALDQSHGADAQFSHDIDDNEYQIVATWRMLAPSPRQAGHPAFLTVGMPAPAGSLR
jgi:hypothetical protein